MRRSNDAGATLSCNPFSSLTDDAMKNLCIIDSTPRAAVMALPSRSADPGARRAVPVVGSVAVEPRGPAPSVIPSTHDPMASRVMPDLQVVDITPRVVHFAEEVTDAQRACIEARERRSVLDR